MQKKDLAGYFLKGIRSVSISLVLGMAVLALSGCGEGLQAGLTAGPTEAVGDTPRAQESSAEQAQSNDGGSQTGQRQENAPALAGKAQASRFLAQATFGPRLDEIEALARNGNDFSAWIDAQLAAQPTYHHALSTALGNDNRTDVWWSAVVDHDDQLRQRMAWALSQILVISDRPTILRNHQGAALDYYDILVRHAFGNYRELLEDVTLSLPMGIYLSMKDSRKYDATTGAHPDENYAREIMQLFTIGLWQLDSAGRKVLQGGKPVPTYAQQDVEALARIFSGWGSADAWAWGNDFSRPMKAYPQYHDSGEKVFLGHRFPAGQTPEEDLKQALDILFNHPNTGPFLSRFLIQRFVTSNPSPDYVQRVAAVFADNGAGVRGDLGAVVRAILLDEEARKPRAEDDSFGKLREPLLRVTHLWRNFSGKPKPGNFWKPEKDFLQAPLRSPTVFNFYPPDFSPVGDIRDAGLVAPEFAITTSTSLTTTTNKLFSMIFARWDAQSSIDIGELVALADDPDALIDRLDLVFMAGKMPQAMRETIRELLVTGSDSALERACDALYLVIASAEYAVQR